MTRHSFLESFSHASAEGLDEPDYNGHLDAAKADAFEAGYSSGWEDAIKSDKTSRLNLEAEFERNIQNLAFTFAEAVTHVRGELHGLLDAIVEHFLPKTASDMLLAHVKSELLKIGDDLTEISVEIMTSPDCYEAVRSMLKDDFSLEPEIIQEESLSAGQVFLRLGKRELEINLDPLIRAVSGQLSAMKTSQNSLGSEDV